MSAEAVPSPMLAVPSEGAAMKAIAFSEASGTACLVDQATCKRVTLISKDGCVIADAVVPGTIVSGCFVDGEGGEMCLVKMDNQIMVRELFFNRVYTCMYLFPCVFVYFLNQVYLCMFCVCMCAYARINALICAHARINACMYAHIHNTMCV